MESPFAAKASCITDTNNATPLHLACASSTVGDRSDLVEVLGTKEAAMCIDKKERTPLHVAAENPKCNKQLIKVLAEINPRAAKVEASNGRMPFHTAIRKHADEAVLKALLKVYPKAAKTVFDGKNTVLHEACQSKVSASVIKAILREAPESAKAKNKFGNIPLHVATAYQNSMDVIQLLLDVYPGGCMIQNRNDDVPLYVLIRIRKRWGGLQAYYSFLSQINDCLMVLFFLF